MLPRADNSLVNICYLVAHDNQSIGQKSCPANTFLVYRDAGRRRFTHVMRSHMIPVHADSGVWGDPFALDSRPSVRRDSR